MKKLVVALFLVLVAGCGGSSGPVYTAPAPESTVVQPPAPKPEKKPDHKKHDHEKHDRKEK